jgi:hypothetical protein
MVELIRSYTVPRPEGMSLSAKNGTQTSGRPDVTWDWRHGKWMVQIRHGRHCLHVGYLDDLDDARDIGAKLLLHVFARWSLLNGLLKVRSPA